MTTFIKYNITLQDSYSNIILKNIWISPPHGLTQIQKSQFPHRCSYNSSNSEITEDKFNPWGGEIQMFLRIMLE
jgi:hypothetical protein